MSFTQQFINKADVITPSTFTATSALSKEEADRFIDYVVDQSFMKNNARIERMSAPTKTIAKIGIGQKILKPAKSAVDPGNTVGITTDQLTLTTKEIIAIAEISDDSLEDNIEGDKFVDHLMKMIAAQSANELDMMAMYGKQIPNFANATDIMQLVNGWVTLAKEKGHVIDARDSVLFADALGIIDPTKFSRIIKTLPNQYRGNKGQLRFYLPDDIYQDYNDYMGSRSVSTADPYLLGVGRLTYSNVALAPVALMPTDRPVVVTVGGTNTTLTAIAAAGASALVVVSNVGLAVGDVVVVGFGTGYAEAVTIATVDGVVTTNVTISGGLYYAHAVGEVVREVELTGSDILLTDNRNLIFGIQRDIRWETERHPRRRSTSFVMTMRVDTQIENEDALVVMHGVKSK